MIRTPSATGPQLSVWRRACNATTIRRRGANRAGNNDPRASLGQLHRHIPHPRGDVLIRVPLRGVVGESITSRTFARALPPAVQSRLRSPCKSEDHRPGVKEPRRGRTGGTGARGPAFRGVSPSCPECLGPGSWPNRDLWRIPADRQGDDTGRNRVVGRTASPVRLCRPSCSSLACGLSPRPARGVCDRWSGPSTRPMRTIRRVRALLPESFRGVGRTLLVGTRPSPVGPDLRCQRRHGGTGPPTPPAA